MKYSAVVLAEDVIESPEMRRAIHDEHKDGFVYAWTLDEAVRLVIDGVGDSRVPAIILAPDLTVPGAAKAAVRGEKESIRIEALVVSDIPGCWELEGIY